jgi:hypothetical protein
LKVVTSEAILGGLVGIHEGNCMDVHTILSAERSLDRPAAVARLALSGRKPPVECPNYLAALEKALWEEYPPFGTELYADLYRDASASGQWLAMSLMTNAQREGDGSKRLWSLAACSDNDEEQQLLKRHACDESSHALAYLALLDLSFPGAVEPTFRAELNQLSPHFSMGQELFTVEGSPYARKPTVDDYMQMNIAEIRTTIHHLMQRTALAAHCPAENLGRTTKILNSLLRDELSHVAYTAVLIERKANGAGPEKLQAMFRKTFRDFNRITSEEPIEYSYNQRFGNYP